MLQMPKHWERMSEFGNWNFFGIWNLEFGTFTMLIFDQLRKNDPQLRLLTLGVMAGMAVLATGLWWVQVVRARDYARSVENQSVRTVRFPAARGKIFDRNHAVLADNEPEYDVNLYIEDLSDRFKQEYSKLRPTRIVTNSLPFWKRWLGISPVKTQRVHLSSDEIAALEDEARFRVASNVVQNVSERMQTPLSLDYKKFKSYYANDRFVPYHIAEGLNPLQVARFEEQASSLPWVDLDVESSRDYPQQTTAAHLLGYVLQNNESRAGEDAYFSYRLPDYGGAVGIEAG